MPPGAPHPSGAWADLDRPPLRVGPLRRALLVPDGPLSRLHLVPSTPSTNADLVAAAGDAGAWPDLSVLVTDHQRAGRGRSGRGWETPARSAVTLSVLLRPDVPPAAWSWLPMLVGLGVVRAVRDVAGLDAGLKWPNDVLVPDDGEPDDGPSLHGARKVAGVLAEVSGTAAVVGIGLNVTQTRAELPVPTATSVRLAGGATTDRDTLVRALLRSVAEEYRRWRAAGGDATACGLADAVRETCLTLGREVRVELPGGGVVLGTAEGLDDRGRLVLRTADDSEVVVAAGDVEHLRDAL